MPRLVAVPPRFHRAIGLSALSVALAAAVLAGVALAGAMHGGRATDPGAHPGSSAPAPAMPGAAPVGRLASWSLFVEQSGFAAGQVRAWRAEGRTTEAAAVRTIAEQPAATWFGDDRAGFAGRAARLSAAAAAVGQLPVISAYFIPGRDCAGHSAGGARDAAAYRMWIGALARALAGRPAIVVLEPDAVAHAVDGCLTETLATERYQLLGEALDAFRADPGVLVYLDAGNPTWVTDPARMAAGLRRAGIDRADGFALNVSNFETTTANIEYGTQISDLLGGKNFVVDTSRNGNGPAAGGAGNHHWCNPPGRRLGETPTTRTGHPRVDAFLWVKRPGESDGACGRGAPAAGRWWPQYALELAGHAGGDPTG